MFESSIFNNIAYGLPDREVTRAEVVAAAERARAKVAADAAEFVEDDGKYTTLNADPEYLEAHRDAIEAEHAAARESSGESKLDACGSRRRISSQKRGSSRGVMARVGASLV